MSSILKALKKIEEESPPPETFSSLPKPIDSRQALNSKTRKRRHYRKTLAFLIVLLVVLGAAVILYSQRGMIVAKIFSPAAPHDRGGSATKTLSENKVYRAKIPAASGKSYRHPSAKSRLPKNRTYSAAPGGNAKKFQADQPSYRSGAAANQRESKPSPLMPRATTELNAKIEKPLEKTISPTKAVPIEKSVSRKADAPVKPAAAAAEQPIPKRPKVSYERIDDSKLKLQALAWSADDARRIAVINGRIVREGESVDGYQIIKIRQEDVVVNDGRKSWRLEFRMQQ